MKPGSIYSKKWNKITTNMGKMQRICLSNTSRCVVYGDDITYLWN